MDSRMDSQVIVRADGQKWQFQVKGWSVWKLGAFVAEALDDKKTNAESVGFVIANLIQRGFPCILTPLAAGNKPEDMREQDVVKNGQRLLDMDGDDIAKVLHAFLASKLVSAIFCLSRGDRAKEWKQSLKNMAMGLQGLDVEETTELATETSDSVGEGSSDL